MIPRLKSFRRIKDVGEIRITSETFRGNNWVIDATHCQGCSSQFTFINRKLHCRRCGGLFCGYYTRQRMYLSGQGESIVHICEPCKTLEEAAHFESDMDTRIKPDKGLQIFYQVMRLMS